MSTCGMEKSNNVRSLLDFMLILGQLKKNKRTGWIRRNIPEPESIADHMYRMAILAMLLEDKAEDETAGTKGTFDRTRCIKISLVHDMCEAIVGDITPHCGIPVDVKHRREKEAMVEMCGKLGKSAADEIMSLYEDYENQTTVEAQIVKDLDRFEMILQAYEYEESTRRPDNPQFLEEFFETTKGKFKNVQIQQWARQLYEMRIALHDSRLPVSSAADTSSNGNATNGAAAHSSEP